MHVKNFLCKRGLVSVTAVFMLLIMLATLTGLIVVFSNINLNSQAMNKIELERAQERISLQTGIASGEIRSVIITNDGSIEVKIRALYQVQDGVTTFLGDPNTDHTTFQPSETYITPAKSITISFQEGKAPSQEAIIIAATERGTKSFDTFSSTLPTPNPSFPPTDLVIGPLILKFKDFQYQETNNGVINPTAWKYGWDIPAGIKCAWKIKITNVDEKDITLSRYSGLTPVANEMSSSRTWYLEPTDSSTLTQLLPAGQDSEIVFIWDAPKSGSSNTPTRFYSTGQVCTSGIFLTWYGVYHELDGETLTPYAQTIPFEAVIMKK